MFFKPPSHDETQRQVRKCVREARHLEGRWQHINKYLYPGAAKLLPRLSYALEMQTQDEHSVSDEEYVAGGSFIAFAAPTRLLVSMMYWAAASHREAPRERIRTLPNRLRAARVLHSFIDSYCRRIACSWFLMFPWQGSWYKVRVCKGRLDLREVAAHGGKDFDKLYMLWDYYLTTQPNRLGIDWLDGPLYAPSLGTLLAMTCITGAYPRDLALYTMLHASLAQFGNLLEGTLPQVASRDPSELPRLPRQRIDRPLIQAWVLAASSTDPRQARRTLPQILRFAQGPGAEVPGLHAACLRIYKDSGAHNAVCGHVLRLRCLQACALAHAMHMHVLLR